VDRSLLEFSEDTNVYFNAYTSFYVHVRTINLAS
jgi:hypothetical protein